MSKLANIILLLIMLACGPTAIAESVMSVITDTGRAVPLTQVQCLIASDDDSKMAIMLSDGLTLSGIDHVTFGLVDNASIKPLESHGQALTIVNQQIIITGAASGAHVTVSDLSGKVAIDTTADSDPCIVDASALAPNQCYIISVNGTSTKIMKR